MKKALTLLIALAMCIGLSSPAFAAQAGDTTITTEDGYTYTLSAPIVAVETWSHDDIVDTVYVIPRGTVITAPADFDVYGLIYYTPPYADNTQPVGMRGNGQAPDLSMDYIGYMYSSYLTMFQGVLADYEPADISQCIVGIVHYIHSEIENDFSFTVAAKIFFRNAQEDTAPVPEVPSVWAVDAVNAATEMGIVPENLQSGYKTPATRAEFCALAVALYEYVTGEEIEGRVQFDDTDDVNVEKAASIGVVNGIGGNKFGPGDKLNREQAATMLARLASAIGKPLTAEASTFVDSAKLSSWAVEAVGQMQATGIMTGVGENTFAPQDDYTREQCILTIMRLFDVVK